MDYPLTVQVIIMHNNPHSHSAGAALARGCSYLRQFIADPRTTGALLPSSAVLCRAMMNQVDWGVSLSIAELGAANGVLTKGILVADAPRCDARCL